MPKTKQGVILYTLPNRIRIRRCESSNIAGIGYDWGHQELYLMFRSGVVYRYKNISIYMQNALKNAASKGQFFAKRIRKYPDLYPYEQV